MNVFYEEAGEFKVGAVLADNVASLQIEAPHGRRSKLKAAAVYLRFERPAIAGFMAEAQKIAERLDVDFLWQCCGPDEFSHDALAREYFGREPTPLESAALLIRLHGAPMYFYKKGKGRYKAAPGDALKAALAGIERRRLQALEKEKYIAQLTGFGLPEEFKPVVRQLLFRPDKASVKWKALEAACAQLRLTPARLLEKCGALPSSHDYHLERFLFEHFPRGTGFPPLPAVDAPRDLPAAEIAAFSIDDATTTEIDDAFSVERLPGGNLRIGIHIAAPALGIVAGSEIDAVARERLSTVYYPGNKITMLPEQAIERFTLAAERACPALSMYVELAPDLRMVAVSSRLERVSIAENLRHDALEQVFNEDTLAMGSVGHRFGEELAVLWRFAGVLEAARGKLESEVGPQRPEHNFYVENDRVRIVERRRGAPIDKLVSELMIHVNTEWGRQLAESGIAAIYRAQASGKVKLSTVPSSHDGLGVEQYAWASSPLRRYVDLVNQRQLIAMLREETPPYAQGAEALLSAMRDFELAYDAYAEFQRTMERYWCLRWLVQENVAETAADVIRDNLVRLDGLPLVIRVASLPEFPAARRVLLAISDIDLLELTLHCEFTRVLEPRS
ncbi:MAG: RNB domain-containing ribonuclease [Betaproteobacteria bacterium]|nr:RNB domain-containing ribonuclease [Betaproteobacteria bacterium]